MFCRMFNVEVFMEYVTKESKNLSIALGQDGECVLLPCYEKMSLKPKIAIISRMMSEKHSNGDCSAPNNSIIK